MANIPNANNVVPGTYSITQTQTTGVAVPGGSRVPALIGEGSTDEVIVAQAVGGGKDGVNPTYTSTTGADGRHFQLTQFPIISNRTTLFRNGIPLVGVEESIDSQPFSDNYDYRVDITKGRIELQTAHLVDQGGQNYLPLSTNIGQGTVNALTLQDANTPPETWTVRCVSVQRNGSNQPIGGTAKFIAFGSVSGAKLDANGNPVIWVANGNVVSNGVLSFSITETVVSSVVVSPFREGDGFTIKVASGVLVKGDTLTANYIAAGNINVPVQTFGMSDVFAYSGTPSLQNNLSLGAQLTYANVAPRAWLCQAAPPMPRRTSYILDEAVDASSGQPDADDNFIFPLPVGVVPDFDANIHFFITNPNTQTESQILPNKLDFYLLNTAGYPTTHQFINDNTPAPGGFSYYYTVIQSSAAIQTGFDGYIARNPSFTNKGTFSSPSVTFTADYVGKTLNIIDAANEANSGAFLVNSVVNGKLNVTKSAAFDDFTNQTGVAFQVIDPTTGLPVVGGSATDGALVKITNSATGTFNSNAVSGVDFSSIASITTKRLQINGTLTNNGLYDIIAFNSGTNTLTIQKAVVDESTMRYEVLDTDQTSDFIVINKNVVPTGYSLRVTIIDDRDKDFYDAGWINALAALETIECDIVVPLPKATPSIIFQNALAHCQTMSNIRNKKERVLFMGAIAGLTPDNLLGNKLAAVEDIGILEGIQGDSVTEVLNGNIEDLANYSVPDAWGSTYRCVYFYPDQITVQAGTDNLLIDGFYTAAAAAGWCAAEAQIQNPMTNKVLAGFTIPNSKKVSTIVAENLAAAGVTVLQPVQGGGRVIWGITTTQSGFPEEQEISIVFIRDHVAKTMRAGLNGFIGTAETPDTQALLNGSVVNILNSLMGSGIITKIGGLTVQRDSVEPRQWNITFKVQPNYGLNWIYIKINVGQI